VSKKTDRLSSPGILVFAGQAAIFESYEDAERYATSLVRDTDEPIKYATILPNTQVGGSHTLMESAVIIVDRGIVAVTSEDAVKDGYLDLDPDPEED
jgi:hypothetical protein